jgi:ribosomal protein S18 acetylase RimI-like enzyme
VEIVSATVGLAPRLAYLINLAGEGLPEYLWSGMAEADESPLDVGSRRAARTEGGFSYTNARVCMESGVLLGMIVAYRLPDACDVGDLAGYPAPVRPLVQLEARAPGSWYVNAVATYPEHRGRGVARALMADAAGRARAAGCEVMSLIVASGNAAALGLYDAIGYQVARTLPVVPYPGCPHGGEWVLMTHRLSSEPR